MSEAAKPRAHSPWRAIFRFIKWAFLILSALVALALLFFAAWDVAGSRRLASAMQKLGERGMPLSHQQVADRLPMKVRRGEIPLADDYLVAWKNGGFYYQAATDLASMTAPAEVLDRVPVAGRLKFAIEAGEPLAPTVANNAAEFLRERRVILDLVHRGGQFTQAFFPVKWHGWRTSRARLRPLVDCVKTLALQSWLYAESGDYSGAIGCFHDGWKLAQAVEDEPLLESARTALAAKDILLRRALTRIVNRTHPSDAELRELQSFLLREADSVFVYDCIENSIGMELISYHEEFRSGLFLLEMVQREQPRSARPPALLPLVIWLRALSGRDKFREAAWIEHWMGMYDLAYGRPPDRLRDLYRPLSDGTPYIAWLSQYEHFSIGSPAMLILENECVRARIRAAATALAARRFRDARGSWPATARELVDEYMDGAPDDPFTAEPLVLAGDGTCLRVFSLGPDGKEGRPLTLDEEREMAGRNFGSDYVQIGLDPDFTIFAGH